MAGKTVAEKLLVKPSAAVWSSDPKRVALIEPLPKGASVVKRLDRAAVAIVFADDAASLRRALEKHSVQLAAPETLWVAYPKANKADINRDTVWPIVAEHGLRPIGQVAVDETWSALRFRPLKEGERPFTGGR